PLVMRHRRNSAGRTPALRCCICVLSWNGGDGGWFFKLRGGDESVDFGAGDVTAEDFGEVFVGVAFGGFFANPHGARANGKGTQLLGQPDFVNLFAVARLGPRDDWCSRSGARPGCG